MGQTPGFDGTHVMTATVSLQDARYRTSDAVTHLFDDTLARMRAVPGVERAAAALTLPYERALNNGFRLVGEHGGVADHQHDVRDAGVFRRAANSDRARTRVHAVGRLGRAAGDHRQSGIRAASLARRGSDRPPGADGGVARTIVGVAGDVQQKVGFGNFGPFGAAPASYVPHAQVSNGFVTMVHTWFSPSWIVRLSGPQEGIVAQMQQAVESVDPLLPVAKFRTLDDVRGEAVATPRAQALLLGTLAGLAAGARGGRPLRPGRECGRRAAA